jgi:hypothetical protein
VSLVHPHETFQVSYRLLVQNSHLFANDPMLAACPYTLKSQVSLDDFRVFISALTGAAVTIKNDNFRGLSQLCEEFQFRDLAAQLSRFCDPDDLKEQLTGRLSALEERIHRHDREIEALRCELLRQLRAPEAIENENLQDMLREMRESTEAVLGRIARLESEVSALKSADVPPQMTSPASVQTLMRLESDMNTFKVGMDSLIISGFTSQGKEPAIVSEFPKIFKEFRGSRFSLLWRGSRDGFRACDFHRRCDGHANTLTVILDIEGNIFGALHCFSALLRCHRRIFEFEFDFDFNNQREELIFRFVISSFFFKTDLPSNVDHGLIMNTNRRFCP